MKFIEDMIGKEIVIPLNCPKTREVDWSPAMEKYLGKIGIIKYVNIEALGCRGYYKAVIIKFKNRSFYFHVVDFKETDMLDSSQLTLF